MHVDGEENLRKFWLAMVTECLRRAASRNLREINSNISHGLIDLILHGKKGKTYFVVHCQYSINVYETYSYLHELLVEFFQNN